MFVVYRKNSDGGVIFVGEYPNNKSEEILKTIRGLERAEVIYTKRPTKLESGKTYPESKLFRLAMQDKKVNSKAISRRAKANKVRKQRQNAKDRQIARDNKKAANIAFILAAGKKGDAKKFIKSTTPKKKKKRAKPVKPTLFDILTVAEETGDISQFLD